MNLPTEDGWYWVVEDIGISQVRAVCWVAISKGGLTKHWPEGTVLILSPWSVYTEPLHWNPELLHKQWKPWDPHKHRAWHGPISKPDEFVLVKTGEKKLWSADDNHW